MMKQNKEAQKFEPLIQKIAPGSRLLRIWELRGGISAEMTAFEIEDSAGQLKKMIVRRPNDRVLRHNPQAAAAEFKILQLLQTTGVTAQIPYYLDQSGEFFSKPCLVIQYIEGQMEFPPANVIDYAVQMATQLARIHQIDSATQDLSFLPKQAARLADQFKKRSENLNDSLDEGRIRETLASVWPLPQRNEPVLLHGDFWPGNTLWRDGRLVAVIDWEDAELGDPLSDFAISRLEMLWIFGLDAMNAFTDRYQSMMRLDDASLPYWDLWAALRLVRLAGANLVDWAAFYPPFGRHDITEQTIREYYRIFITQAFEKLAAQ